MAMGKATQQRKGSFRAADKAVTEEDEEDEKTDDRVCEWEEGLPSLADLISLSQCLISPQLASAFSITFPSPSPPPSSTDVALASHTVLSSLCGTATRPDPPASSVAGPFALTSSCEIRPPEEGCHSHVDNHLAEHIRSHGGIIPQESDNGETISPPDVAHRTIRSDETPFRDRADGSQPTDDELCKGHGRNAFHMSSASCDAERKGYSAANAMESSQYPVQVADGEGGTDGSMGQRSARCGQRDGYAHANAGMPCVSEWNNVAATRVNEIGEVVEAESASLPLGNASEEASARTLKRPRLVWTPELHKRFVEAVTYLGVTTAVPKTIMQLMNVEGLTRENVASHLQKYRLYLKRIQGPSADGLLASDHFFASVPMPGNIPPARFPPPRVQDLNQVPFIASPNPISMGRGHVAGIVPRPFPALDPYAYNVAFARPVHRLAPGDMADVVPLRQNYTDSSQHPPRS